MEKIFSANNEINTKLIGRSFPQVTGSDTEELFNENGKYDNAEKFLIMPSGGFSVKISKSVKETDILSSFMTVHSPLVSEKLVSILTEFSLPVYRVIPIRLIQDKLAIVSKKYFIMHFIGNDIENLNFLKSEFDYYTGAKNTILDKSILHFHDYHDFLAKSSNDNRISMSKVKRIVMKKTLEHDLFFLDRLNGTTTFITGKLKNTLIENEVTGFRFTEVGYVEQL